MTTRPTFASACAYAIAGFAAALFAVSPTHASPRPAQFESNPSWVATPALGAGGLCLGDANADGLLDLGIATYRSGSAQTPKESKIFFNSGQTLSTSASWTGTDEAWSTACLFGLMGSSGYPDFIVVNGGSSRDSPVIYRTSGSTISTAPGWEASNSHQGSGLGVAFGDVNLDGVPDLFIANQCYSPCDVVEVAGYLSSGGSLPETPNWLSGTLAQFSSVALGDPDRSGVEVAHHTAAGNGTRKVFHLPGAPVHALLRILVDGGNPGKVTYNLKSGYVAFATPPASGMQVTFMYEVSSQLDLAAAASPGGIKLFAHSGGSLATTASWSADSNARYKELAFVDLNLDGYPEIFAAGRSGEPCKVYSNQQGVLSTNASWTYEDCDAQDLAVMDANGDGYPDILMVSFSGTTVLRLFLNDEGTLESAPSTTFPWGGMSVGGCAAGDVTGDGMPEIIVGYASNPPEIYRNLQNPLDPPSVTSVTPTQIDSGQQTPITIQGSRFLNPVRVFLGDTELDVTSHGETVIEATVPQGTPVESDTELVVVNPDLQADGYCCFTSTGNQPPTVDAGTDQTVAIQSVAQLHGIASDDGQPDPPGELTISWVMVSGPGTADIINPNSASTTATFTEPGVYILSLTASDGQLSASDQVTVTVRDASGQPDAGPGSDGTTTSGCSCTTHSVRTLPSAPAFIALALLMMVLAFRRRRN